MTRPARSKRLLAERPGENATSQRIVSAARRYFFSHGFRSVTMDDLAAELGMSKKTLYAAFASKSDLLRAVLLDKFRSIEIDLDGIMSSRSSDVLASLQELLACVQRHAERSSGNVSVGAESPPGHDSALFRQDFRRRTESRNYSKRHSYEVNDRD